ncbi:hypothetical protein DL93DRAFT_2052337 [Clavulina sp. PMI_390]|nr:hypothetical protein DL93DRAFT_2052337 [Clavulina sp. PMI_390]
MSDDEEMYDSAPEDFGSDDDMVDGTQESESGMSYFGFDSVVLDKGKSKLKSYEVEAKAMSAKDLEAAMKHEADEVSDIYGTDTPTVFVLLRSQAWNRERLIDTFGENPSKVMKAAGVIDPSLSPTSPSASQSVSSPPSSQSQSQSQSQPTRRSTRGAPVRKQSAPIAPSRSNEPFMCPICCDDAPTASFDLGCGHVFCDNCWRTYLHTKIHDEGEVAIQCMDDGCKIQANDEFVEPAVVVEDKPVSDVDRYTELLIRDFVAHTPSIKFCPYPSCTQALKCNPAARKGALNTLVPTVVCGEGHEFCFGCAQEGGHRPVICSVSKMWLKKCADDSETANWIKSNTKECPKCQSTIEKNGGCNHMTCKKCKYEFCWVCMGNWTEHGSSWYSCNRYDDKDSANARDQQSKSRASLERYLHYYNRWANHEQSAKLSLDLYAKTEKKMEEMQITSNLTWIEVQFAKKAVEELLRCRMTLKWTYAMAYYLEKSEENNSKELFEDNQADLEKAVEDLSELLEQPIEPETIATLRQKMTDKTVYVAKRNETVLEDTAKGFQEGRWQWNVPVGST